MKQIKFTLSGANGENLGSFTLDPLAQINLMAWAKADGKTLAECARDALRGPLLCDEHETMKEVSEELAVA